ncbi:methyl-accepting chemotaxis protein, partial [Ramlibacter sp.]|uniref:methyl-accepting chemotaxis protein n=1 Tax=Ramlibacter sp. TaxID=1917967 RepID=UPI002CF30BD1
MRNIKISTRVLALVLTLSVMLLVGGAMGLWAIGASNASLKTVYEDRAVPIAQLGDISRLMLRSRLAVANSVMEPSTTEKNTAEVLANIAAIDKQWQDYMVSPPTGQEAALAKEFAEARGKFVAEGLKASVAALRAQDLEGARNVIAQKTRPLYDAANAPLAKLVTLQEDVAKAEHAAAVARYEIVRALVVVGLSGGIGFAALFGFLLVRGISRGLQEAVDTCDAVAHGDLQHEIRVVGKDEVARLMSGMAAMQASLRGIVTRVRQGTDTIATASGQIAAGNQDLSQRTEEQASSLEETAASMEELTGTVKQNADNARQANQLAQSSSEVARKGGAVVEQVVETMDAINASSR